MSLVELTPDQIHRLLGLINAELIVLDRERHAMSINEQGAVIAKQQALVAIQKQLRKGL